MAKPEWGVKRTCTECHKRFYDLGRDPVTCPYCGAQFDPAQFSAPGGAVALARAPIEDEEEVVEEVLDEDALEETSVEDDLAVPLEEEDEVEETPKVPVDDDDEGLIDDDEAVILDEDDEDLPDDLEDVDIEEDDET